MTRVFKASTKQGASIIKRASYYEGFSLDEVYGSFSPSKANSWKWCFTKYCDTPKSRNFHICSHNSFQYSVSWDGEYNGERATFVETANNSFVVLLDK